MNIRNDPQGTSPAHAITASEAVIEGFWNDGAAVIRDALAMEWVDRLRLTVDDLLLDPKKPLADMTGRGTFFSGSYLWQSVPDFRALIFDSPLAELAAQFLRSKKVNFFYDQTFVKEPGAIEKTLWHQDLVFWPIDGEQIISFWIPLDRSTPENGVVTYIKGSHASGKLYKRQFLDRKLLDESGAAALRDLHERSPYLPVPDIDRAPEKFEYLTWNVDPGDIIVHHARALHGANGNLSSSARRRAVSLRWTGEDAIFKRRPGDFLDRPGEAERRGITLREGDPLDSELFPVVLPRRS